MEAEDLMRRINEIIVRRNSMQNKFEGIIAEPEEEQPVAQQEGNATPAGTAAPSTSNHLAEFMRRIDEIDDEGVSIQQDL